MNQQIFGVPLSKIQFNDERLSDLICQILPQKGLTDLSRTIRNSLPTGLSLQYALEAWSDNNACGIAALMNRLAEPFTGCSFRTATSVKGETWFGFVPDAPWNQTEKTNSLTIADCIAEITAFLANFGDDIPYPQWEDIYD